MTQSKTGIAASCRFAAAVLSMLALCLAVSSAHAQVAARRLALVIGNDSYSKIAPLSNARRDAQSVADALRRVDYQVSLSLDLDHRAMLQALRNFKQQVNGGDEVVVFFSGHGVQLGAANYLLPIDLAADNEEQVRDEAIALQRVLDDLAERRAKFSLAIVDACRNNPFKSQGRSIGGTRGLAATSAATGQMVIYSAGTGQLALDSLSEKDVVRNGIFTRVFVKEMLVPDVPIDRVLKNVRVQVRDLAASVGHEQVPAIYDQVAGDFYFTRSGAGTGTAATATATATATAGTALAAAAVIAAAPTSAGAPRARAEGSTSVVAAAPKAATSSAASGASADEADLADIWKQIQRGGFSAAETRSPAKR